MRQILGQYRPAIDTGAGLRIIGLAMTRMTPRSAAVWAGGILTGISLALGPAPAADGRTADAVWLKSAAADLRASTPQLSWMQIDSARRAVHVGFSPWPTDYLRIIKQMTWRMSQGHGGRVFVKAYNADKFDSPRDDGKGWYCRATGYRGYVTQMTCYTGSWLIYYPVLTK